MSQRLQQANAIRFLAIDAIEKARSGHPGMPMGMADIAQVLWQDFMHHNPCDPAWLNRDRFVLSNGHGSMLLYALLHLSGYAVTLDDIKKFRQLSSITPGHPELGVTPGVEATTGPLGQGLANAVGMAVAARVMAETYNRPGYDIFSNYTYVFLGDGCLMEGISHEASSLAGTLALGRLIAFWDNNGISIDGKVDAWFSEDVVKRYHAYGWHVIADVDGHNPDAISAAITTAKNNHDKPTLICCRTVIGFGSASYGNTAKVHGSPLGAAEVAKVRAELKWPHDEFVIPVEIKKSWDACEKGTEIQAKWQDLLVSYGQHYPDLYQSLLSRVNQHQPDNWPQITASWLSEIQQQQNKIATRKSSLRCLEFLTAKLPQLFGGSADLSCSNLTEVAAATAVHKAWENANYLYYGVREFGMFAMLNGLSSYGGFIPFAGTFLTFVDYGRNALRLAAMAKQQVIYVLTHDSIGLGEDGPTHQPVEHAAMLRATPGVRVWRPADELETAIAWLDAIAYTDGPSCLLLSRQALPAVTSVGFEVEKVKRGGYILYKAAAVPQAIIIATGSEVHLAVAAAKAITSATVNVVSMPCIEVFLQQSDSYQDEVLPAKVRARVAVEALSSQSWHQFVGVDGVIVSVDRFGESAPAADVFTAFGFTVAAIKDRVERVLQR